MIEKLQQQSAISCKLVRVSAALDPAKMALLESEVNNLCLTKSLISCISRNVFLENREVSLMTSLKGC